MEAVDDWLIYVCVSLEGGVHLKNYLMRVVFIESNPHESSLYGIRSFHVCRKKLF